MTPGKRVGQSNQVGSQQEPEPSQSSCPLQNAPSQRLLFVSWVLTSLLPRLLPGPPAQYLLWLAAPLFLGEGSGLLLFEDWAILGVWVLAFAPSV